MLRILHLSDLHFGKPFEPKVAAAFCVQAHARSPDVIVVSGDLTQRAKPAEFAAARQFLEGLPHVPRIVVPGNHDVPLYRIVERFTRPLEAYRSAIQPETDSVLRLPEGTLVGLDSTDPYRSVRNGRITRRQLEFCAHAFDSTPPRVPRIVVLHHHLVPAPSFHQAPPMPKAKRLLETLTQLKVDLVLAGHMHRAYVGNSLDVYAGPDRDHGIIIAQCGTTTSRRGRGYEREKNSFNWIEVTNHSIRIHHFIYFSETHGFLEESRHQFARLTVDAPAETTTLV